MKIFFINYAAFILPAFFSIAMGSCPSGSMEWNSRCYIFISQASSFMVAEMQCDYLGAHLVSIHNAFVNALLAQTGSQTFHETSESDMWTGGMSISPQSWTWMDGTKFNFNNWDKGQPSNSTSDDACVSMSLSTGKWEAEDCFKSKPFVCQQPADPSPISNCRRGWIYYEPTQSCFGMTYRGQKYPIVTTWNDAVTHCRNLGGDLPSIRDIYEFDVLQAFIISAMRPIWIGLQTRDYGSTWTWSDGTANYYQPPWNKDYGFPIKSMEISCGIANLTFLENYDCDTKAWVICKQSAL